MLWFILSMITAFTVAARDISAKTYDELSPLDIAAIELFWAFPFFVVGYFLIPIPPLSYEFWHAFLLSLPLNIIPYFLYLYAIKKSPISLTVPFLSLTPLFMILTGYMTLNESVSLFGFYGILFIVLGGYVLNLNHVNKGLFAPVKALFYEKGSRYMILVAAFYAFASVYGKKAIIHSSPLFFSYFFFMTFNGLVLVLLIFLRKINFQTITQHKRKGLWLGSLMMVHISTHCMAISISTAVYMIAVKRSSILLSVLLGWLILKEEHIKYRAFGALLMFLGLIFILSASA